jgi:hypothetical protein
MRKTTARFLANLGRLALAVGLLALVFSRIDRAALVTVLRQAGSRYEWLIAAVAVYGIIAAIGLVRWQLLLRGQAILLPWPRVAAITFIGLFFNAFLFGATGGDLARLYYAARAAPRRKAEAAVTIAVDRLIGMLAMMVLAAVVILMRWPFLRAQPETRLTASAVLILAAALPTAALLLVLLHRFRHAPALRWVRTHSTLAPFLRRLFHAVIAYRRHPLYLASTFSLSVVGHLVTVGICALIGHALGVSLSLADYLVGVPIVLTLASFPITPAGLGLREGLAVTVLGAFGVDKPHALSLSLMIFAAALAWSLVGGLVFLMHAIVPGRSLRDQMRDIRETSDEA